MNTKGGLLRALGLVLYVLALGGVIAAIGSLSKTGGVVAAAIDGAFALLLVLGGVSARRKGNEFVDKAAAQNSR